MPMPCYLTLTAKKQGKIDGSVQVKGHEKKILIQSLDHLIEIPRNPQTGLPAGKRVHGPMVLTKELDESSPKLQQALTSGEQFSSVLLEFFRISPTGTEEKYYTVKLENAILTQIRMWFPNCLVQENKQMGHMEDLAFTYEKIIWEHVAKGISADDSWLAPKT